ncbi:carbon-nitrogen family hydrolase [Paenibacillus sp. FSL H7-0331]|uniref:carbon-nitrogen family hydrolase n=1 Tax=Paenibacillus sp. FSL H7-0331 TaxID=1920421 RepID=UPI00096DE73A|nr:carbon-nitrogen family hydrolase [Paenibacillus sp. FSL H7-0331]OMF20538.1 carbon-nitrogen hydrolase [Paenibacillus sp. FSL H7-0331]
MTLNNRKWNLALLQMDIAIGEPELNYAKLEKLLNQAVEGETKPDVIIFPEMWNTGYALDRIQELADEEGQRTHALLSEFSRKHQVNIIGGSIAEKQGNQIYNTIYAYNREGSRVADYSKIHLFRLMDEEKYLEEGSHIGQFELDGVSSGMMICYDIRFPELSRKLALGGAQIVFVPAEWPNPRLHHWRTLLMARAIENQMFVVSCNRVGISGTTEFFGHSMVVDPWGEALAEGDETEQVIRAQIDLALVDEVRSRIPVFEDRRPALY